MTGGSVEARWSSHIRDARNARRPTAIQRAINKYGSENFNVEDLEKSDDREFLCERETHWITTLGTLAPRGYNLKSGGESGYQFTAEAKRKISAGVVLSRLDPIVRERHAFNSAAASRVASARQKRSELSKQFWEDEERREHQRAIMRAHWSDGKRAEAYSERMKKTWQDESYKMNATNNARAAAPCVSIEGIVYRSQADASEQLNIPKYTVNYRVRSNLAKWKDWFNVEK